MPRFRPLSFNMLEVDWCGGERQLSCSALLLAPVVCGFCLGGHCARREARMWHCRAGRATIAPPDPACTPPPPPPPTFHDERVCCLQWAGRQGGMARRDGPPRCGRQGHARSLEGRGGAAARPHRGTVMQQPPPCWGRPCASFTRSCSIVRRRGLEDLCCSRFGRPGFVNTVDGTHERVQCARRL